MVQGLAGMRRLVQTLQDQLDSSSRTPSETDAAAASESARKPSSHAQAFALDSIRRISREMVAAKAAWALANLAANNKEGQDSIRQEHYWKKQNQRITVCFGATVFTVANNLTSWCAPSWSQAPEQQNSVGCQRCVSRVHNVRRVKNSMLLPMLLDCCSVMARIAAHQLSVCSPRDDITSTRCILLARTCTTLQIPWSSQG